MHYEGHTGRLRCRRVAACSAVRAEDGGPHLHGLAGPAVAAALGRQAQEAESGAERQCRNARQWWPRDGAPGEAKEALTWCLAAQAAHPAQQRDT